MKKGPKIMIWTVVIAFVAYHSVYFKKLSDVKASGKTFDAIAYAADMLNNRLPAVADKAVNIDQLIAEINADKVKAFADYGHALAIGSTRFFMVKGSGRLSDINESDAGLITGGNNHVQIATEYVFGNAVRDASGLVNLNDFSNTVDLSNISSAVDRLIRRQVVPPFKAAAKKGDTVVFTGAIELNQEHLKLTGIEVMPVRLQINH